MTTDVQSKGSRGSLRDPRCVLCAMSPTHPCREHQNGTEIVRGGGMLK